jgi:probable FeS assembly SUF system protein SufT
VTTRWTPILLTRDCTATTVPYGERVALTGGGEVQIVQQLGSSITVRTEYGPLLRIDGVDADALGLDTPPGTVPGADGPFDMRHVTDALQGVYDPEIPVSIVELGLVYRCDEVHLPDGTRRIEIDMTMTAPGCGMGDVLRADTTRAVEALPGVDEVEVTLVWNPPWTVHRMSEAARLQLGLL